MIKHANEMPVTYLNKGQIYLMSIVDTAPAMLEPISVQYRTSIRMSFEDELGRRSETNWQIWKEARGTKEADQRGGKLQSVEYVEVQQATKYDSIVKLDTACIDGFSVLWSRGLGGWAGCNLAVRFNFLSTDFSHAKGVGGIPSRLCVKTVVVSPRSLQSLSEVPEVCFCEVRLLRDHGAERKHKNNIAHVNKVIDKLKQQIAEVETKMNRLEKEKHRASTTTKATQRSRLGDAPNRKRTWSMSSESSAEENLRSKMSTMQDMLFSTQPVSILNVRGQERDDPDRHPILLISEHLNLTKAESKETIGLQRRKSGRSLRIAGTHIITSSSESSEAPEGAWLPALSWRSGFQPMPPSSTELQQSNPQHLASPPDEVEKPQQDSDGILSKLIKAFHVESTSRCPPERHVKPGTSNIPIHRDILLTAFQLLVSTSSIENQMVRPRRNIIKQCIL